MSTTAASRRSPKPAARAAYKDAPKQRKIIVTPAGPRHIDASLLKRMTVDKNIVDELLLICGVIGTTTTDNEDSEEKLIPVAECLYWLQDLLRCLRRDVDLYRPISLLLGQWRVVPQKLLPLVMHSRYDTDTVLTVAKILVILTKPLSVNTVNAGRMVIDTKSGKTSDRCVVTRRCCGRSGERHCAMPC